MKVFVKGFSDSLPIFKDKLPKRKKDKRSFSQSALASDFLDEKDIVVAHNAINDVKMLQALMKNINVENDLIIKHSQSINFIANSKERDT